MDGSLTQPCRVQEDGPMGCKLLLQAEKSGIAILSDGSLRIRIG